MRSPLPRVGVGVLIVDNQRQVLLTLRKRPPEAGNWSIVGGKLEYLETLSACALREAREEVGVDVSIEGLPCVTDHLLPEEGQHWVSPAYLGRIASGRAKTASRGRLAKFAGFPSINSPGISP